MKWLFLLLMINDAKREPTEEDAKGCALLFLAVIWFMGFFYLQFILFPGQYWVTFAYIGLTALILTLTDYAHQRGD